MVAPVDIGIRRGNPPVVARVDIGVRRGNPPVVAPIYAQAVTVLFDPKFIGDRCFEYCRQPASGLFNSTFKTVPSFNYRSPITNPQSLSVYPAARLFKMNLADCYRLLGLSSEASTAEIKASYRRLARQYHPDVNPGDQLAAEKFIIVTQAYQLLLTVVNKSVAPEEFKQQPEEDIISHQPPTVKVTRTQKAQEQKAELSLLEQQLKSNSYKQLQELLKSRKFPRAIALVEGLASRIPQDQEVRQWQAIAYQRWGRQLVKEKQLDKARIYLKKALRTDPHNRSLWLEIEQDFRRIEQIL